MKITYSGRHITLAPSQTEELEAEFAKLTKLLDTQKGEAEAHVFLNHEHAINQAEVTVKYRQYEAVGQAEHNDLFAAIHAAIGKVHAQLTKQRERARDLKRVPVNQVS